MSANSTYEFILAGNIEAEDIKKGFKLKDYCNYCKIYAREFEYKESSQKIKHYQNKENELYKKFTFIDKSEGTEIIGQNKNCKISEFPFIWLKNNMSGDPNKATQVLEFTADKLRAENLAGIFENTEALQKYLKKLPPCSFALTAEIKLNAPYFSSDDDNFYLVDNPVLKEQVFKVPMVRGSGWKGALAAAAKELVSENFSNFLPFARIWGLGSSEYRNLLESLKDEDPEKLKTRIISLSLFELGLKLDKNDINDINNKPQEFLKKLSQDLTIKNVKNKALLPYLQPHKGRAIFYPTFFNKLSLEVINPHDRQKRAGTKPIFYEIVPEGTAGRLQIIYIPHDALLTENQVLKEQVTRDLSFLCKTIEKAADQGIGAKTKLGWGRFKLVKKYCICNKDFTAEGWDKC